MDRIEWVSKLDTHTVLQIDPDGQHYRKPMQWTGAPDETCDDVDSIHTIA